MSIRVGLFVASFLGFLYSVLSITNAARADMFVGMAVAAVGVVGWIVCDVIEEIR